MNFLITRPVTVKQTVNYKLTIVGSIYSNLCTANVLMQTNTKTTLKN